MLDHYPADIQEFVKQKIAAGSFQSVDEFAVEAASLYQELDRRHQNLRQHVQEGIKQLDEGDVVELADDDALAKYFDRIKQRGRDDLQRESAS